MNHPLLLPMALYVFYVWGLALKMFFTRLGSIKSGQVSPKYFKAFEGSPPPERVALMGQHYDNQFQVPILFLVTGALFLGLGVTNGTTLILAWGFVLSRFFHSWVHLGTNNIKHRAAAFALGWLMIVLLWGQLVFLAA